MKFEGPSQQIMIFNVFLFQGKFKMRLKAERMIDDRSVCKTTRAVKMGTMRVKPTTFNKAVTVNASVLCPTCDCEQVNPHSHQRAAKVKDATIMVTSPSQTVVEKASRCHGNGKLVCGKCECYDGW